MREVPTGSTGTAALLTDQTHTAEHIGNPAVRAISTVTLVVLLEEAAHNCIRRYFEEGEVSLGTKLDVRHIDAAQPATEIVATAVVAATSRNRVEFDVTVTAKCGRLLMTGKHERVVVMLERFLQSLGQK
jgi:fluoroacetyl-CoA thioesterase